MGYTIKQSLIMRLVVISIYAPVVCLVGQQSAKSNTTEALHVEDEEASAAKRWLTSRMREPAQQPQDLEQSQVLLVPEDTREEAIAMLKTQFVVPLTQEQFIHLMRAQSVPGGVARPYLIRAVAANKGGGQFAVSVVGTNVYVMNFSLGPFRYERKPLVVFLEKQPEFVWVMARSGD